MNSTDTADDGEDGGSKTTLAVEKNASFVDDSYSVPSQGTSNAYTSDTEVDTTSKEGETSTTQGIADFIETQGDRRLLDENITPIQRFASVEPNEAAFMHSETHMQILTTVSQQDMQESPSTIDNIAESITGSSLLYSQEHILQTQIYSQTIALEPPAASDADTNTGLKARATEHVEEEVDTRSTGENDEQIGSPVSVPTWDSFPAHELQATSVALTVGYDGNQEDEFTNSNEDNDNSGEDTYGEANFDTQTTDTHDIATEEPIVSDRCLQATDCLTSFDNNIPSENKVSEVSTSPFNSASALQNNSTEEKVSMEVVKENATKAFKSADGRRHTTDHSMQPVIQTEESTNGFSKAASEPSIIPGSAEILGTMNLTPSTSGPTEGSVSTDVFGSENVHGINRTQIPTTASIQEAQTASLAGDYVPSRTDVVTGQFEAYSSPNAGVIQADTADIFGTGDDRSFLQTTPVRAESIISTNVMDSEAVHSNNQAQLSVTSSVRDVHAPSTTNDGLPSLAESVPYSTDVMQTDIQSFALQPSVTSRGTDRSTDGESHFSNTDMVEQYYNQSQAFEVYTSEASVDISESTNSPHEVEVSSEENSKMSTIQTPESGMSTETQETNPNPTREEQDSVSPMTSSSLDSNAADGIEAVSSGELLEYHFDASTQAAINSGSLDDGTTHASSGYITKILPVSTSSAASSEPTATELCSADCESKQVLIENVKSEPKREGTIKSTASGEHITTNRVSTDDRASSQPADTSTKALMPIAGSAYKATDQKTEVSTAGQFREPPTNAVGSNEISMATEGMQMHAHKPTVSTKSLKPQLSEATGDVAQNTTHGTSVQTVAQPSGVYKENGGDIKPAGGRNPSNNPYRTDLKDPANLKSTEATSGGNKKATSAPIALGVIGGNLFNLYKCPRCTSASKLVGPLVVDVVACLIMLQL
ncbi:unnamed protein product [Dibothriocephalus latus]|uniref:Uncharacterized protein n=1 Tax=Dibothriocephalus latus TaxID=60516 RepID=A0A3P6TN79_DIBLA|nr:unnamed protein product [Dibothriocephalus latus]